MIKFNPKGEFLMEFCFINLFLFENKVSLFSNASIFEKAQFYFFKRRIKILVNKVKKLILGRSISNIDEILERLLKNNFSVWDSLLVIIIIKETIRPISVKRKLKINLLTNFIVLDYVTEVKELGKYPTIGAQIKSDLLKAEAELDLYMTLLKIT